MENIKAKANIVTLADSEALARKSLEIFVTCAKQAVAHTGWFRAALSGGNTPRRLFELLATHSIASEIPWQKTQLFWVDEHCVPPDSKWSNYKLAADTFLSRVPIPADQVHRIRAESTDCKAAAREYEQAVRRVFRLKPGQLPEFDLIVLGMGADAHTGSLFRDSYAVFDKDDLACAVYFMDGKRNRITLTHPVLCAARHIIILISGAEKAEALKEVLTSEPDEVKYPIHTLSPVIDRVTWLVDNDAAQLL